MFTMQNGWENRVRLIVCRWEPFLETIRFIRLLAFRITNGAPQFNISPLICIGYLNLRWLGFTFKLTHF